MSKDSKNHTKRLSRREPASGPTEAATSSGPSPSVTQFVDLVRSGADKWVRAGMMLVKLYEKDPQIFSKIIAKNPWLTVDSLATFHAIGMKKIRPEVLLMPGTTRRKLLELDYAEQSRLLDNPVPVVAGRENGKVVIEHKPIMALSPKQASQAIGHNGSRTTEEQLERIATKNRKVVSLGHYRVVMRFGKPVLEKIPAQRLDAQRVILNETIGDLCGFIEFTKWEQDN